MTENVENLVLEQLRAIRGDMAKMDGKIDTLGAEMRAMRQLMSGVMTLQEHDHSDIAELKGRLDRIERRLELTD